MNSKLILIIAALMICALSRSTNAQCNSANLKSVDELAKDALVIDVRPNEINQFKGTSAFKEEAYIALVNMNPFLFSYTLKVDQTEIHDTGFLNFLNLLGSPVSDLIGSVSASSKNVALSATAGGNLQLLIDRTAAPGAPNAACAQRADATLAIARLADVRTLVVNRLNGTPASPGVAAVVGLTAMVDAATRDYATARGHFQAQKDILFDSSVEAAPLCVSANTLHGQLTTANYPTVERIRTLSTAVLDFQSLVEELKNGAIEYNREYDGCPARLNGVNYANTVTRLADELAKLGEAYETKVNAMLEETKSYEALV